MCDVAYQALSRFSACNIESWVGPGDEAKKNAQRQARGSIREVKSDTVTTQHEPETVSQFDEPRITQAMKKMCDYTLKRVAVMHQIL